MHKYVRTWELVGSSLAMTHSTYIRPNPRGCAMVNPRRCGICGGHHSVKLLRTQPPPQRNLVCSALTGSSTILAFSLLESFQATLGEICFVLSFRLGKNMDITRHTTQLQDTCLVDLGWLSGAAVRHSSESFELQHRRSPGEGVASAAGVCRELQTAFIQRCGPKMRPSSSTGLGIASGCLDGRTVVARARLQSNAKMLLWQIPSPVPHHPNQRNIQ